MCDKRRPMKILFDHSQPFFLAHGGFQTQIEQTKKALERLGVDVEWLRWWDDAQQGDLIHFFGRPSHAYLTFARSKGLKVLIAELLTGLGSRKPWARRLQRTVIATLRRSYFFDRMGWQSYQLADGAVALTTWEAQLMHEVFEAPTDRVHVVPNGVEEVFLQAAQPAERGRWLVCTATIAPRKRVVELAAAAATARTPLWILGTPYAEGDPYAVEFRRLAAAHPEIIRFEGGISDRARLAGIYAEARGFVLLSTMESLSLSSLEASACGCPLLLSDLPWARSAFGKHASYCPIASEAITAGRLREFYDAAPGIPCPPQPASWMEVGEKFRDLYARLLNSSR